MDTETLRVLDFTLIREMLADFCVTTMGKENARQLLPNLDKDEVQQRLIQLEEITQFDGDPPLSGICDISEVLVRVDAGAVLTVDELLRVRSVCIGLRDCEVFFKRNRQFIKSLNYLVQQIVALPELERAIEWVIDESGAIRDQATPRLAELRDELRKRRNILVQRMEAMIQENPEWFDGPVMVRRERFVLPVRLEQRNQVAGVVHSVSASGRTLFVEPMETIEEQNFIQELRDAETEEVNKILRGLSVLVARYREQLRTALMAVGKLDLLMGKIKFARKFDCHPPVISDGVIEVIQARHPLLMLHKEVVPLTFRVPDNTTVVLISGPNAGGKTVVLKTLGLCALLLKAGMFIPAGVGTKLPWFERVFADIGDEQSLERDTSSFTAHLEKLKGILDGAIDGRSLVLVDEIGAATAPEEGAGLAIAVLEELAHRGVWTFATTHFNSLKMFVQNQPMMVNAGMEFQDGPTYRLIIGLPGESSAFAIAEQSGFPVRLLERARRFAGKEWTEFRVKLQEVEDERRRLERLRMEIEEEKEQVGRMAKEYQQRMADFEEWARWERQRFQDEKEQWLRETRRQVENLVRELRESNAGRESVVRAKRFIEEQLATIKKENKNGTVSGNGTSICSVGDVVESRLFRRRGKVVEVKGDRVLVAFGNIKMEMDARTLLRVSDSEIGMQSESEQEYEFIPRLNVRGMSREEAELALIQFIAEAEAAGVKEISILHGKGTGVLRQMIWAKLRKDRRVAQVRFAEPSEGGMGVTVVKLRRSYD